MVSPLTNLIMWTIVILFFLFEIALCIRLYMFLGSVCRKAAFWFSNLPEAKDEGFGNHRK